MIDLKISFEDKTVCLSQKQIIELFNQKIVTINEDIKNIFLTGELNENSVCSKMEVTVMDGKKYNTKIYNPNMIISPRCRVAFLSN